MIRGVAKQYERENEVAVVTDIINRAKSGGRGALGLEDVENALDMQLVSLLILPYPIEARIADELIMKAVNSSSDIEFVKGEAAEILNEAGGIAAKLYFVI
jgi:peptide subunit release factor 1 (eRF1)